MVGKDGFGVDSKLAAISWIYKWKEVLYYWGYMMLEHNWQQILVGFQGTRDTADNLRYWDSLKSGHDNHSTCTVSDFQLVVKDFDPHWDCSSTDPFDKLGSILNSPVQTGASRNNVCHVELNVACGNVFVTSTLVWRWTRCECEKLLIQSFN